MAILVVGSRVKLGPGHQLAERKDLKDVVLTVAEIDPWSDALILRAARGLVLATSGTVIKVPREEVRV